LVDISGYELPTQLHNVTQKDCENILKSFLGYYFLKYPVALHIKHCSKNFFTII